MLELCGWADAVVLGPGLAPDDASRALVDAVVRGTETPLLLDAGALYALNGRLETLRDRPGPTVLTPHAGELARLLDVPPGIVVAASPGCGGGRGGWRGILLKGPDSLVLGRPAAAGRRDARAGAGHGGAGDVLGGVGGTLLARGSSLPRPWRWRPWPTAPRRPRRPPSTAR